MSTTTANEKTVSDGQSSTTEQRGREVSIEHEPAGRSACPECQGQVITEDEESFCTECGLVVAAEWVDRSPSLADLGMVGDAEMSIEPVNELRVDNGMHTKIAKSTDGRGNPLSSERWQKFQRLRKRHKRYQFGTQRNRAKRLNEALRDVEMIGGNLDLPDHIVKMAAQYMRGAAEARLPGGHMAWETLAGGAVLLAVRKSRIDRTEIDKAVTTHTKAPRERVCAAARKIRCETEADVPVVRPEAVMDIVDALKEDALPGAQAVRRWRLAQYLMQLGDQEPVGPGTPRSTVAAAALYAADRLLPEKQFTQQQVADAASTVVPTSKGRIARYSRELFDAYVDRHGTDDPEVGLEAERNTLR
ncbi:transcription initiation factor IIB family protein [Halomicrobium salinisoli]|uniref:transcription initiation factor IIB family protein n=1 Tax=Halomicrobium salinisoli TaxID=2878391 RepID=UPI001CEFC724|nr:transcription initiation factor IIB family protein [Halomicrobium salinisoli]